MKYSAVVIFVLAACAAHAMPQKWITPKRLERHVQLTTWANHATFELARRLGKDTCTISLLQREMSNHLVCNQAKPFHSLERGELKRIALADHRSIRYHVSTERQLKWLRTHRPTLDQAIKLAEDPHYQPSGIGTAFEHTQGQLLAEFSRPIFTIDRSIVNGFATEGLLRSKMRGLDRMQALSSNHELSTLREDVNQAYLNDAPVHDLLLQIKSGILSLLPQLDLERLEKPLDLRRDAIRVVPTHVGASLNKLVATHLGDNYQNALLHGSFARHLTDSQAKRPDDIDLLVIVKDYPDAIAALVDAGPFVHEGHEVNIVLVPEAAIPNLMAAQPDGWHRVEEGYALREGLELTSQRPSRDHAHHKLALNHQMVRGLLASFPWIKYDLVKRTGLVRAMTKVPRVNYSMVSYIQSGATWSESSPGYRDLVLRQRDPDPRTMPIATPEQIADALATTLVLDHAVLEPMFDN